MIVLFAFLSLAVCGKNVFGQGVKRIVIIKADGVPNDFIDKYVKLQDPTTGKSKLPWIEEVFYKNGTRLENFYVRGISLSAPAWSLLDTGQHLQIKGNVEFSRYTMDAHYYLNFIPFQIDYGLKRRSDMPGVELLDRLHTPLLIDAFPYENRIVGYQLFQRDNRWNTFIQSFANVFPPRFEDLIDEYTMGFSFREAPTDQVERDILNYLSSKPEIDYMDYFSSVFDHTSHHVSDDFSKYKALKSLDSVVGRIWTAIQNSPRANETALFIISDHGTNSQEGVYSQGFNLVNTLSSASGGGHHVVTKRRTLTNYRVAPEIPFFPSSITTSKDSFYLKDESSKYPTVLIDFDGNERASIYFRDNDFNLLHILLKQLKNKKIKPDLRNAAKEAFFDILNRRREEWQFKIFGFQEELAALNRSLESQQKIIAAFPKKYTEEELHKGIDRENIRLMRLNKIATHEKVRSQEYLQILSNLVALREDNFNPSKLKIEDYLPSRGMGERNSVYNLQNYVVGVAPGGLVTNQNGSLDLEKSFRRVNYFEYLQNQKVLNNVQKELSNYPIDFISTTIPLRSIAPFLQNDLLPNCDPIFVYGGEDKQALILSRKDDQGKLSIRYLPISGLKQLANGDFDFQVHEWSEGFPLKIFEDANLNIPEGNKKSWLNKWHTEIEWFNAVHKTFYSNAVIGLTEQLNEQPIAYFEDNKNASADEKLIQRMIVRQRDLARSDLLILGNDHWNFDAIGFNPGGNHGSFFRVSTNSILMMAGGSQTKIPQGLNITTPYDSLSFVPTVLALMGKVDKNGYPVEELYKKGFRKFPGRIINEVFENQK